MAPGSLAGHSKSIRDWGITDMEIYRLEDRLFMIMDTTDGFTFERKAAMDAANPEVQRWEELMWKYSRRFQVESRVRNGG